MRDTEVRSQRSKIIGLKAVATVSVLVSSLWILISDFGDSALLLEFLDDLFIRRVVAQRV